MGRNRIARCGAAIALVACFVSAASAIGPTVSYSLPSSSQTSGTGPLSASETNAYSNGSVSVDYGWARLDASTTAIYTGGALHTESMFVTAGWRDFVTIDSAGLTGSTGTAYGALNVTGGASGSFPNYDWEAFATYDIQVLINGVSQPVASGTWINGTWDGQLPITVELPVEFTFGESFMMEVVIQVYTSASNYWLWQNTPNEGEFATARMDLGHTIEWAGLSQVEDADSNIVFQQGESSDLTFSSFTQTDWTAPVEAPPIPEPATLGLLAAGAMVMIRRRRAA